ncbi:MAG: hypothetical protein EA353_01075 [Puniceicoccaceae bacterium]|nr:MAG: hypothetical protein EA353_01075 [Puniceicoccaceae bacterium]
MTSFFHKTQSQPEDPRRFMCDQATLINGSLCVFGDWFGRPMDNWHRLISHEEDHFSVKMLFNEGETLEVWQPSGFRLDRQGFIIQSASRVRWEWFYYGRPQLPENRFFIEHRVVGESVLASSNVDWAPHCFKPSMTEPAVLIK